MLKIICFKIVLLIYFGYHEYRIEMQNECANTSENFQFNFTQLAVNSG